MTDASKKYPNLDRFGQQAGKPNENFFSAGLFVKAFLKPCESVRPAEGVADGGEPRLVHVGIVRTMAADHPSRPVLLDSA